MAVDYRTRYECIHCKRSLTAEWVNSPIRIVPREDDLCPGAASPWAIHAPRIVGRHGE